MDTTQKTEQIEISLLLEGIYRRYGYDFRNYAQASISRRIRHRLTIYKLENISELMHLVLHDETVFGQVLQDFSINVTEMFRDPDFYRQLRKKVLPALQEFSHIKIWHAGCSTGEEVYSMAILLKEFGLLDRTRIYATDYNEKVIEVAKSGIYPLDQMRVYTQNYQKSGGKKSFADYYNTDNAKAIMDRTLKENIVFADHNLSTDTVFGEMHLIVCRNVMIYFNRELQNRVVKLFHDSLIQGGFLCLGTQESIRFAKLSECFENVNIKEKIYRKTGENGARHD
jgi:chemotaxis protein methyltransferase CheR